MDSDKVSKNIKGVLNMNEKMNDAIKQAILDSLLQGEDFFEGNNDLQTMTEQVTERLADYLHEIINDEIKNYETYVKGE